MLGLLFACIFESMSLNGDWEMSYQPYAWENNACPVFSGVTVKNAVPGYWEDMRDAFRAAGMSCDFRINPHYRRQHLPITGRAEDTTLPDIYGSFFYRRFVSLPEEKTKRVALAFEGVRNQVHLWINGAFVAFHAGFSTPFELTIPEGILKAGRNEIVLAVSNIPNLGYLGAPVSGLTTRSVFRSTGGINGNLELRFKKSNLRDVYVTTARDLQSFTVHVSGSEPYSYEIADEGNVVSSGTANGDFTLPTAGYRFWTPETPHRYTLRIRTTAGEYCQRFGLRRLVARGEKLFLNDRPIYLRGVTEHCYFPKTVHVPRDLAYYRMVTQKRKELGFNFVRFHTFVPPVEYLEALDELGMLAHIETPNFVTEAEFRAVVAFARTHPSVVIYCTGNETRIDRLVEVYLNQVADMVHRETDSLFSPMSAMRSVEYMFAPCDSTVDQPLRHNPERLQRLAVYCDLWNAFQLGVTSYSSLDYGTPADLDRWGDAYCNKPRLSHEICIDGSYADLSLEHSYPPNSPIVRTGLFSEIRRVLAEKGLLARADLYFRNSCEWMWRIRKHCFEKMRASDRNAGYDFLGDINTHWHTFGYSVGMMDEFYRLKPGESVRNVLRYNAAAVVLSDLGSDFNVEAGTTRIVSFSLSNYEAAAHGGKLIVTLQGEDGAEVCSKVLEMAALPNGVLSKLGKVDVAFPSADVVRKYVLNARFESDAVRTENQWECYAFPKQPVAASVGLTALDDTASRETLLSALARGERVVLMGGRKLFKGQVSSFRIGCAGRCAGNYATVLNVSHPLFVDFPRESYCGWAFRRLFDQGWLVQLEGAIPFDPIVDVASSVKCPIRQSPLFEYAVGSGRLLVCSFNFSPQDPAAAWLKARIMSYAASTAFKPRQALTPTQLMAVMDAEQITPGVDTNRARNPGDPASVVRAGAFAMP